MHDETMRDLKCTHIQADEIWGFVGKKQRNATEGEQLAGFGDVWTVVGFETPTRRLRPPTSSVSATTRTRTALSLTSRRGCAVKSTFQPMG